MYLDRKNNYYNIVQFRLKTIKLKLNLVIKKVELTANIRGLVSFSHYLVMESLNLLEFLANKRAAVNSFKQKYKTVNIQLKTDLQDDKLSYFFNIIKIFYLPAFKRQNFWFFLSQIFSSKFIFNIAHPTLIPFLPNTYFKWKCLINVVFFFNKSNAEEILLFLNYLGFYFLEEEDFFLWVLDLNKEIINNKYVI